MFLAYSNKELEVVRRHAAALLIFALLLTSSPAPVMFAQESGEEPVPQQQEKQPPEAQEEQTENSGGEEGGEENTEENSESGSGGQSGGDAVVETGDAQSQVEVENEVNTNETDTTGEEEEDTEEETPDTQSTTTPVSPDGSQGGPASSEEGEGGEQGTSTPATSQTEEEEDGETGTSTPVSPDGSQGGSETLDTGEQATTTASTASSSSATTTVASENDAELENAATSTAQTGENTATSTQGSALVSTGDALASANVVNVVNTNIINSNGFLLLLNLLFGAGTFDLRALNFNSWFSGGPSAGEHEAAADEPAKDPCSLKECGSGGVMHVVSTSTAKISNDVVVRAGTGDNSASSSGGSASVSTGNAYASANVVNVANTNIVNSNYLLVALNNFGELDGDIVFPGAEFFAKLLSQGGASAQVSVANENAATTTNSVSVGADSGNNAATSTEGGASVETGAAVAAANTVNKINTNSVGGSSLYILLRVHGQWTGDLFGLPEGLAWEETPSGITIYSTGEGEGNSMSPGGALSVAGTNDAVIDNDVSVYALTGENKVSSSGGSASVHTGNAYASANVLNVANTNVVGQNWILAIFNIFGNWSGNLSFGRPDLWVGGRAQSSDNPLSSGSKVTYHFTVTNFGDAEATDVVLKNTYDESLLSFGEAGDEWYFGTLGPGESEELSYAAGVTNDLNYGETPVVLETTVSSRETDNNTKDNTERLALVASNPLPYYPGGIRYGKGFGPNAASKYDHANLKLTKEASVSEITASSTVDYTITIENHGDSAYEAVLVDALTDEEGNLVTRQEWPLDEIFPDEEIKVTYTISFDKETPEGVYVNEAQVLAMDERSYESDEYESANSNIAYAEILVHALAQNCTPYLARYLRFGRDNNEEDVSRLQDFLREQEGFDVETTGEFDRATLDAVHAFQRRYAQDILYPWGVTQSSGYVYYTTQKKINELFYADAQSCGEALDFTLTDAQRAEIERYRALLEEQQNEGEEPDTSDIGRLEEDAVLAKEEELEGMGDGARAYMERAAVSAASSVGHGFSSTFFGLLGKVLGNVTSWLEGGSQLQSRR